MPTVEENREFGKAILVSWPLDDAVDWIAEHLDPADVFPEERLTEWVEAQGYKRG